MIKWLKNFRNFKCHFCGVRDENVQQTYFKYYVVEYLRFHEKCLKDIACNPDDYSIEDVRYARRIFKWEKRIKEREEQRIAVEAADRKELKEMCIE